MGLKLSKVNPNPAKSTNKCAHVGKINKSNTKSNMLQVIARLAYYSNVNIEVNDLSKYPGMKV